MRRPHDDGWRFDPALGGHMRAITEIGTHWVDLAMHWTGLPVEAVCAATGNFYPTRYRHGRRLTLEPGGQPVVTDTEDAAAVVLRFQGGAIGTVLLSRSLARARQRSRARSRLRARQRRVARNRTGRAPARVRRRTAAWRARRSRPCRARTRSCRCFPPPMPTWPCPRAPRRRLPHLPRRRVPRPRVRGHRRKRPHRPLGLRFFLERAGGWGTVVETDNKKEGAAT